MDLFKAGRARLQFSSAGAAGSWVLADENRGLARRSPPVRDDPHGASRVWAPGARKLHALMGPNQEISSRQRWTLSFQFSESRACRELARRSAALAKG